MSKELEALKNIHSHWNCCNPNSNGCDDKDFDTIENALKEYEKLKEEKLLLSACRDLPTLEKKLKALEIIVRKEVNIFWIKLCFGEFKGLEMYNTGGKKTLTRKEYELLKEVLL